MASAAMHKDDHFALHMGLDIEHSEAGASRLSLTVREEMLNGHAICHGGTIFTLADTALAHASNSYNVVSVAVSCAIEFVAPARLNDRLTATAEEQLKAGRNGVYDVRVVNQHDDLVALFRGKTRAIGGSIVDDAE
jgi:acyl-CoA thioesterase